MKKNEFELISLVITYYKKKKFLYKTLKSILRQNYKNYEIIFVYDDEDLTDLSFVKKKLSIFKKKKIIINKKNLGAAMSRNIAIRYCKGQYLAFIDSDDIWKKNKLYYQLKFMKNNAYLFSFTSYDIIDENNHVLKKRVVKQDANYRNLLRSNFIGLSTVMMHKKLYKKFKFPHLKTQEDFALWLKISKNGYRLRHIRKTLSYWRKTPSSLSSNSFRKLIDAFKLYNIYQDKNFIFSIYSVLILSLNKLIKEIF